MRQLKMFAPLQPICLECRCQFVPFHRDAILLWSQEEPLIDDWLSSTNWAADRVYQQNVRYCSAECAQTAYLRAAEFELEREKHKLYGKRR